MKLVPPALARFALRVLTASTVLSAFILVYALVQGRIAFALIASLGVAGLLAARRLSPERRVECALLIGISGIAVYSVELGVTLTAGPTRCDAIFQRVQCHAAYRLGRPFDFRTGGEVMAELENARGVTVWPDVHPIQIGLRAVAPGDSVMPFGGIPNVPTLYCNESGTWVTYQSDEHGFRNPPGAFGQSGDATVTLIGDSFAQGFCTPEGETIADYLRSAGWAVLNLGSDGDGPLVMLGTLKEFAIAPGRTGPVIWLYFEGNDLEDLEREKEDVFLRRYLTGPAFQRLTERQPEVDSILLAWAAIARSEIDTMAAWVEPSRNPAKAVLGLVLLRRLRALAIAGLSPKDPPTTPIDSTLFRKILREAKRTTDMASRPLVFVYLPEWSRFARGPFNPHREAVTRTVAGLGIPIIDLTDIFAATDDPLEMFPNRANGHYNATGYGLVATAIEEWLRQR